MALSKNQRGLFSLLGGVMLNLAFGCIFALGTFNVYIVSYVNHFKQYDPYPLSYGYFIMPIITFTMAIFGPIGGIIDYAYGCHMTVIIAGFIVVCSALLMYFVTHMYLIYLALVLYGVGNGLGFMAPIKNACFFFPEKKGIISASIGAFTGLGGALYSYFGESMINPNNIQIKEGEIYYDYEIAKNTLNYYLFQIIIITVGTAIGSLLIFRYKVEEEDIERGIPESNQKLIRDSSLQQSRESSPNDQSNEQIAIESTSVNQAKEEDKFKYKQDLKKVFKSKRIWLLFTLTFCSGFLSFLIVSTFKVIGTTQMFSINSLKIAGVGAAIGISVFSPLWGLLYDYFGFKYLIAIINLSGIAVGVSICFSMDNEVIFVTLIILNTILLSGVMSVFNPHTMKVFGIKYITEIGGLMGFVPGICNVLSAVFAFFVSLYFSAQSEVFYISYCLGALFHLISFVLAFFESGLPFNFDDDNKKLVNEEETKGEGVILKKEGSDSEEDKANIDIVNDIVFVESN